ncbi:sensor histidine kinase [Paenibacillus jiagnxiensis]|uniref:sensor histidine kinase n=1 Tax=Paenibacillus jiagnxiensis TaxID=3228926 RepID=UPI0038D4538D
MLQLDAPSPIPVSGDEECLTQLLVILLDNAIKYTPDGGRVGLQLSQPHMKNKKLVIQVQDTGIGIAAEEQKHIFDRFYRVDKSRSRELGGHGLGLSIAKWIAEAHQGTIKVASAPGQGSIFTVEIPLP